jgi:multicomponent Na+:H+ antiporter subunit C
MIGSFPYLVVGILFVMGFVGLVFERNLIKIAISMSVIEVATNLFIITLGYRSGGSIPVWTMAGSGSSRMVLPPPQALTLTAIVIGLATTSLMLSFAMLIYRHYGSLDVRDIRRLRG